MGHEIVLGRGLKRTNSYFTWISMHRKGHCCKLFCSKTAVHNDIFKFKADGTNSMYTHAVIYGI